MVPEPMKLCDHNKTNKWTNNYGISTTRWVSYWLCGEESFRLMTRHSFYHKCHTFNLESIFFCTKAIFLVSCLHLVNEIYLLGIINQIFQILITFVDWHDNF